MFDYLKSFRKIVWVLTNKNLFVGCVFRPKGSSKRAKFLYQITKTRDEF